MTVLNTANTWLISFTVRVFKTLVAFVGYLWCVIVVAASRGIIHLSDSPGDAASVLVH